eukprot:scaffold52709_cov57-Phaeocystis_antarctica.AAC.2
MLLSYEPQACRGKKMTLTNCQLGAAPAQLAAPHSHAPLTSAPHSTAHSHTGPPWPVARGPTTRHTTLGCHSSGSMCASPFKVARCVQRPQPSQMVVSSSVESWSQPQTGHGSVPPTLA